MKLIKPSYEILTKISANSILRNIEDAARTCYKSEDDVKVRNSDGELVSPKHISANEYSEPVSALKLVDTLVKKKHEAMLEFSGQIVVKFICDRGVSHELVRHRVASFAQESTRYCNYQKDKFGNELTFIIPCWMYDKEFNEEDFKAITIPARTPKDIWLRTCHKAEMDYNALLEHGWAPQEHGLYYRTH